ncbi:Halomucin [Wickerhamomyces ciferrii]|uniref:Halomucin n=1 Tax=Wickerhamomyces ciferrii (strain ATCC 14091 / BCRC 22168 / CBS 111 / JCM 3599 / NBRC 0793 / NRRL Y-1031 F-60-10) TaxID=1206466 RepID=K0KNB8_WICCF|nr:Halomucin [Wickerhamomyces ciferrii]CCH44486.1 Halomucin [Wickerhamomyces ciferrii]
MVQGKHIKIACQVCIRGHRTKTCNHLSSINSNDPEYDGFRGCLEVIPKKGRRKSRIPDHIGGFKPGQVTLNPNNDKFILVDAKLVPKLNEWCPNSKNFRYECAYPCCKKKPTELYINEEFSSFLRVPQYCDLKSIEDAKRIGIPVSYKDLPIDFLHTDVNFHSIGKLYPDKSDYPNQSIGEVINANPQSVNIPVLPQEAQSNNNTDLSESISNNPVTPSYSENLDYQHSNSSTTTSLNSNFNGDTNQYFNKDQNNHQNNIYHNRNYVDNYINGYIDNHHNDNIIDHNNQSFDVNGLNNTTHYNNTADDNQLSVLGTSISTNSRPHQPSFQSNPIVPSTFNNSTTTTQQLNLAHGEPWKDNDFGSDDDDGSDDDESDDDESDDDESDDNESDNNESDDIESDEYSEFSEDHEEIEEDSDTIVGSDDDDTIMGDDDAEEEEEDKDNDDSTNNSHDVDDDEDDEEDDEEDEEDMPKFYISQEQQVKLNLARRFRQLLRIKSALQNPYSNDIDNLEFSSIYDVNKEIRIVEEKIEVSKGKKGKYHQSLNNVISTSNTLRNNVQNGNGFGSSRYSSMFVSQREKLKYVNYNSNRAHPLIPTSSYVDNYDDNSGDSSPNLTDTDDPSFNVDDYIDNDEDDL